MRPAQSIFSDLLRCVCLVFLLACVGCATSRGGYHVGNGYNAGQNAYDDGNYIEATKQFERYLSTNPDSELHEIALYYLGASHRKSGNRLRAKEAYQQLINQYDSSAWVNWAREDLDMLNSGR